MGRVVDCRLQPFFPIDAWLKVFHIQPRSHIPLDQRERQGFSKIIILA